MPYPKWPFLFLPWIRHELPGWGRILEAAHVGEAEPKDWAGAPTVQIRGKWHGYRINTRLSNRIGRRMYFLARPSDLALQLCMMEFIRLGETFVDVGAAGGMISLHGAGIVGESGQVYAFEPNPLVMKGLRDAMDLNNLVHVTPMEYALGDEPARMTLRVVGSEQGTATLAPVTGADAGRVSESHEVEVARGDDLLFDRLQGNIFIKIDAEGFELRILRGFQRTVEALRPAIVTECVDAHLERAETSREELFGYLESLGYAGCVIDTERRGIAQRLVRFPCREAPDERYAGHETNVLWIHPDSAFAARVPSE